MIDLHNIQQLIAYYSCIFLGLIVTTPFIFFLNNILKNNKFISFLIWFLPSISIFYASSISYICTIVGNFLGESESTGFYILLLFGCMFASDSFLLLHPTSDKN